MLIPPSLLLIIYGVLAEQSIGTLFIAGLIPGRADGSRIRVMIMLMARYSPALVFDLERQAEAGAAAPAAERVLGRGEIAVEADPISSLVRW